MGVGKVSLSGIKKSSSLKKVQYEIFQIMNLWPLTNGFIYQQILESFRSCNYLMASAASYVLYEINITDSSEDGPGVH